MSVKYASDNTSTEATTSEASEAELCCVCNDYWVSSEQLNAIERLFMSDLPEQRGKSHLSASLAIAYLRRVVEFEAAKIDLCDTLILCDGCDGSFHALCVGKLSFLRLTIYLLITTPSIGLTAIPSDDWFCYFCSNNTTPVE